MSKAMGSDTSGVEGPRGLNNEDPGCLKKTLPLDMRGALSG